jgi:S1-C subfamily serine protease
MRRQTLYSSTRSSNSGHNTQVDEAQRPDNAAASPAAKPEAKRGRFSLRFVYKRHRPLFWFGTAALLALLAAAPYALHTLTPREITQKDIDDAVLHTLETQILPSPAVKAYETIRPSVVRVRRMDPDKGGGEDKETGVGSGVVIVDKGTILTSLHVVLGAKRVQVVFFDGSVSEAHITGAQPEHDLAVLQAHTLPDDLVAATLRSTADLAPGEQVVAVGFPFGIGPSASAGVVSGLRREFLSPEGNRLLTNLIQFDAAVNPGNSGGPLVTTSGEVVGIVTAILNPTQQRFFVGIGFAVPIENAAAAVGIPPF